jgi:hypothetical protein
LIFFIHRIYVSVQNTRTIAIIHGTSYELIKTNYSYADDAVKDKGKARSKAFVKLCIQTPKKYRIISRFFVAFSILSICSTIGLSYSSIKITTFFY